MLKKILCILFLSGATLVASAQGVNPVANDSTADSLYKKILLIPYNPIMHVSDTDHDIAEYNQLSVTLVKAAFRRGLLQSLSAGLTHIFETQPLIPENSKENRKELDMIYGSLNYQMDTVFPVSHPLSADSSQKKGMLKSVFSKNHSSKLKEIHDLKYMNIKLSHPELLAKLAEKYGNDLFVFLNQFEIKTNYDDCLDLALKIYRRELKVHYSVFDLTGKQLYGDVAVVNFPSNTNDITEIMQRNFPKISDLIVQTVPKRK